MIEDVEEMANLVPQILTQIHHDPHQKSLDIFSPVLELAPLVSDV